MKRLNLAGMRFGRLTVLYALPDQNGRSRWMCKCDCGNYTSAKTIHLRNGHVKSCGCLSGLDSLTYKDGTCLELIKTGKVRKNNKSGVPGVFWDKKTQKWRAQICFKGKCMTLGRFKLFRDAVDARKDAEECFFGKFIEEIERKNKCNIR